MNTSESTQPTFGRKPSRFIRFFWTAVRFGIGVALIGAFAFGLFELYRRMSPVAGADSDVMRHTVQRRTLDDTVIERGTVESQNTVYGKCELPGSESSIVFIVPEGTLVAKGDVIVKLESAKIDQQIALKRIALNEAEGKLKEAQQNLIAKRNEGDGIRQDGMRDGSLCFAYATTASEQWTVDSGQWTVDSGQWTATVHYGIQTQPQHGNLNSIH